uniref:Alternative protein TSPAN3 n=1 Tax=Homo sapiens TaxID=9606 RepID=L8E893_HUMAN|nr:alternative protein TSPAN3 [Homo sapiens]
MPKCHQVLSVFTVENSWPKVFAGRRRKPAFWLRLTPDGAPHWCPFKKYLL